MEVIKEMEDKYLLDQLQEMRNNLNAALITVDYLLEMEIEKESDNESSLYYTKKEIDQMLR